MSSCDLVLALPLTRLAKLDEPLTLSGLPISHYKMGEEKETMSSLLLALNVLNFFPFSCACVCVCVCVVYV